VTVEWMSCEVPELLKSSCFAANDDRGAFRKVISGRLPGQELFRLDEVFWSRSHRGVLRGLHVQTPPRAGRKIVFVTSGEVRDFVVDLRVGSPSYGLPWETRLDHDSGALLIPDGCAHGFEALTDDVTMVYLQEGTHDPSSDTGVLWSSVGIHASSSSPIVSPRDNSLPTFEDFESPFTWVEP
jgi:dTDP-4-dehydrorhamnose 3,5-epimerase